VTQLEAAQEAQRAAVESTTDVFKEAERKLFQAERDLGKFAETMEDVLASVATIKELDQKKYSDFLSSAIVVVCNNSMTI
jgi:hypothetical protein